MGILIIIPCGKEKIWDRNPNKGPTPASDAYTSEYFKTNKSYAERFAQKWVILSGKYGFIEPDFLIPENYNVTYNDTSTNPTAISDLIKQIKLKGLYESDEIIVLGGKNYREITKRAFNKKILTPFAGIMDIKGIMKATQQAIKSGNPFPFGKKG